MKDLNHPTLEKVALDTARRLRLLELSFARIAVATFYTLFVGVAMLIWAAIEGFPLLPMTIWTLAFFVLSPAARSSLNEFRKELPLARDIGEPALTKMHQRWYRRVLLYAALLGSLLGILGLVNAQAGSFEFQLLLTVIVAIMMATNAAHQTPVLNIYYTYYVLAWGGTLASLPIIFPEHWPYLLGLGAIHAGSLAIDARRINRFFVNQVELEQQSAELAEEARLALQQKNEFLATASHDLRQPLHALNLNVEALSLSKPGQDSRELQEDIKACARNLTQMFNSILDLSKLEAGGALIENRPINVNLFLVDMSHVFAVEARQRKLDFRLRLPRNAVVIETDENLLRQIVSNLLQNAIRYTNSGGILLGLRDHRCPRIEVIDTGIGIAEEDKHYVHQPFYRGRVGFTESVDSHGLGLAVVSRCAALLDAKYGFRSQPDHGSRFWVSFAAGSKTLRSSQISALPRGNLPTYTNALAGDRCLIVEDDPIVVRGWQNFLNPTGIELTITADRRQTEALLDSGYRPDYALCDLRLRSGDNGYSVLLSILAVRPDASGAMVSGEFDAKELLEAAEEGIAVLQKPVSPEALMQLLMSWRTHSGDRGR